MEFVELRKKLPTKYAKLIAEKLSSHGIDASKVARVFAQQVTDPTTVELVVDAAIALEKEERQRKERLSKKLKKVAA